jgi:hypothetical protein
MHAVSEGSKFWEEIPMQDGRFFFLTSFLGQNWHTYVSAQDWKVCLVDLKERSKRENPRAVLL